MHVQGKVGQHGIVSFTVETAKTPMQCGINTRHHTLVSRMRSIQGGKQLQEPTRKKGLSRRFTPWPEDQRRTFRGG